MNANQERDLSLISEVRAGDERSLAELIEKYRPMVRFIARSKGVYVCDQDDLVQEGMIGLLDAAAQYDGGVRGVKFSSFAYICVLRKVYNYIRRFNSGKQRALNGAVSLSTLVGQPEEGRTVMDMVGDHQASPDEILEEKWIRQRIREVLRTHLSILEYAVTVMLLNGYSAPEIEEELGLSPKCVDNARTRARAKLGRILEKYGSLLSPHIPSEVRRRRDLYVALNRLERSSHGNGRSGAAGGAAPG